MLRIKGAGGEFVMEPGEWRSLPEHDVAVGQHLPPSSNRVPDFMRHFETRYRQQGQGNGSRIFALQAAHHRLNYIHPFPDAIPRPAIPFPNGNSPAYFERCCPRSRGSTATASHVAN